MFWEQQWEKKLDSININKRGNTLLPGSYSESPSPAIAIGEIIQKKSGSWPHPQCQVLSWLLQKHLTLCYKKKLLEKSKDRSSTAIREELLRFKQALSEGSWAEPSWDGSAIAQLHLMEQQSGFTFAPSLLWFLHKHPLWGMGLMMVVRWVSALLWDGEGDGHGVWRTREDRGNSPVWNGIRRDCKRWERLCPCGSDSSPQPSRERR